MLSQCFSHLAKRWLHSTERKSSCLIDGSSLSQPLLHWNLRKWQYKQAPGNVFIVRSLNPHRYQMWMFRGIVHTCHILLIFLLEDDKCNNEHMYILFIMCSLKIKPKTTVLDFIWNDGKDETQKKKYSTYSYLYHTACWNL